MEGYTLAMDFKWHEGIRDLVNQLDEFVLKYNGRVYLAKDALSNEKLIPNRISSSSRFSSIQSKRMDL